MRRVVEGVDRSQITLCLERLDDRIERPDAYLDTALTKVKLPNHPILSERAATEPASFG